ncbi:hypothetical protein RHGRI_007193 [Rhododendron griersonianum]|uniref:Transposase-associated domain-containing protein n=1 Tax=Rhododendron griersonianum TaxID=479676 RepID=A0AAV6JNY9_9ERIC|nr:hypothetical protein RHGRI_015901 [Rhododendron griersonianum]KAG5556857.1 hypothetical protein RHGRI_007193 [Rhododendron griersonianum]
MDKSWMQLKDRWCSTYVEGVRDFLRIANNYAGQGGKIRCPCKNCNNVYIRQIYEVKQHLFLHGILEDYSPWIHHGEPSQSRDQNEANELCEEDGRGDRDENTYNDVHEMLDELQTGTFANARAAEGSSSNPPNVPEREVDKFERLLRDAKFDIIELQYCHGNRVFLFKCDWWDTSNKKTGIKKDGHLTSVNISRKWYKDDPFVLATQAEQVFYINDIKNGGTWQVVQKTCPRNLFDVSEKEEKEDGDDDAEVLIFNDEPYQQFVPNDPNEVEQVDDRGVSSLNRTDVYSDHVDADVVLSRGSSSLLDDDFINDEVDEEDDTMIDYNNDDCSDEEDVEDSDNDSDDDSDDDTY